jgi:hypothetical protein
VTSFIPYISIGILSIFALLYFGKDSGQLEYGITFGICWFVLFTILLVCILYF